MARQKVRLLLDTNVWRYIVDAAAWPEFLRLVRSREINILIAPSVVYEALRTQDNELRRRLTSVMTMPIWTRLMPEAYTECEELFGEIARLRSHSILKAIDKNNYTRNRYDWTRKRGGLWDRVKNRPDFAATLITSLESGDIGRARDEAKERRDLMRTSQWSETIPLNSIKAKPFEELRGWNGDEVEAWRLQTWNIITKMVQIEGGAYHDWLSPRVDLSRMQFDDSSWLRFWLYEVDPRLMPRLWLRWAFEYLQTFRKVTDGTPCDAQLASYLPEADEVISADKVFIQITEKCRAFAPLDLPSTVLIPGGAKGVEVLLNHIQS